MNLNNMGGIQFPFQQPNGIYYPTPNIDLIPFINNTTNNNNRTRTQTPSCAAQSTTPSLKSALKTRGGECGTGGRTSKNTSQTHTGSSKSKHVQIDPHPDWNDTERRVWEEFKIIQSMEARERLEGAGGLNPDQVGPETGAAGADEAGNMNIEAEWRVRRSKDGKHLYIKKTNSNRTKMLKKREEQIDQQRCGVTTDDDAFTVYQGQYWNKQQRRRQLNRHNDRRQRSLQKTADRERYDNKTEKLMAEIVQRKMTLPGKVFDNFVTVEEILSQRNRAGTLQGPIHVTTI